MPADKGPFESHSDPAVPSFQPRLQLALRQHFKFMGLRSESPRNAKKLLF